MLLRSKPFTRPPVPLAPGGRYAHTPQCKFKSTAKYATVAKVRLQSPAVSTNSTARADRCVWCHTCPLPLVQDRPARAWLGWKNTSPPGSTPCHALAQVHGITICQANRSAASCVAKSFRLFTSFQWLPRRFVPPPLRSASHAGSTKIIRRAYLPPLRLHSTKCSSPATSTSLRSSPPWHRQERATHHA